MAKQIETLRHSEDSRANIPTAEQEPTLQKDVLEAIRATYSRCNGDLDPQLVWRGKGLAEWSDLVVPVPPLFIQEKVQPKVLIDDLVHRANREAPPPSI